MSGVRAVVKRLSGGVGSCIFWICIDCVDFCRLDLVLMYCAFACGKII